jgi:hypothetical protein
MTTVSKNNTSRKSPNLTDIALIILSRAAQRQDRLVIPVPNSISAPSEKISKTLKSLLSRGLIAECPAKLEDAIWRTDEQERHLTLRISSAGEEAIATGPVVDVRETKIPSNANPNRPLRGEQAKKNRVVGKARPINAKRKASRARPQKKTTKAATILVLLRRPEGATIAQLVKTTGWQAQRGPPTNPSLDWLLADMLGGTRL